MAWPAGMPLVTITQDVHKLSDGSPPSSYAVHLRLSVPALVYDGVTTLIRRSIMLTAEPGSGVISDQVPHLNHPDLSPTPVYYMVTEFADGQRVRDPWQLTPAADDVTIDLDARAPIAGDPGTPVAVGPRGASTLAGLDDVDTTGLEDGFTIIWDATSETWQVGAGGAGAAALADLTDVDLTDLADGDALVWDATAGKWVRVPLSSTYAPIPTGTPDGTKFYKDDGTWGVPAGGGTPDTGTRDVIALMSNSDAHYLNWGPEYHIRRIGPVVYFSMMLYVKVPDPPTLLSVHPGGSGPTVSPVPVGFRPSGYAIFHGLYHYIQMTPYGGLSVHRFPAQAALRQPWEDGQELACSGSWITLDPMPADEDLPGIATS